ncbi:MAG TPA: complex I subunit 1 family protein [Cytophagaceae bacterium]|nr:complex I subunit 1 family protein [Cytophagaceae bacterium]
MLAFVIFLGLICTYMIFAVYLERKISAFIQDRLGPMEVGYYGIGQTVADLLKLLMKEDIVPINADRKIFLVAPVIIFASVFAGFATLPLSPDIIGSHAEVGVFYLLTIISFDVVGLLLAGWGSNNKFSVLGAMRAVAQIISYEIPLSLTVVSVVMISQTLDLQMISFQQGIHIQGIPDYESNYLFGLKLLGINVTDLGGIFSWNIFRMPLFFLAYLIFFICSLAECNRAPFDIPEAESELVAGFHTEYSGFRWAFLFLAEYAMMLLMAALGVILFLGSWNTVLPNIGSVRLADWTSGMPGTISGNLWGAFWLLSKTFTVIVLQMFIRWTYPRLRPDQLMYLSWKVLTPAALLIVLISGVWRLLMI